MRTVATALVLIAGAAVILWYGSTLNNSLVLGGLIGGLAALLLSIPISLTLFSHFSRRHDERMEEQDGAVRLTREYDYPAIPTRRANEVEAEGYTIDEVDAYNEDMYDDEGDDAYWQKEDVARRRALRRLAAPESNAQRTGQTGLRHNVSRQAMNSDSDTRLPAARSQAYLPAPRQQAQQPSQVQQPQQGTTQRRDTKVLRSSSLNTLSQHRMDALRTARLEAARASQDESEVSSTQYPRQDRSARQNQSSRNRSGQETQGTQGSIRRSSHPSRARNDATTDTTSSKANRRELYRASTEDVSTIQTPSGREEIRREPQTDYIENQVSRTTPMHRNPQTEQVVRRVRTKDLNANQPSTPEDTETASNLFKRPLLRRAPYMYEDDELRRQLAQQIDPPAVRRSSRQEAWQEDD